VAEVFCYPDVGRAGLGNMLFPWAKAEVFRSRHGVRMLAPQWTQPKIGPLLRRERDLRYYTGLFDHRRSGYVRGLAKLWALWRGKRVTPEQGEALMAAGKKAESPTIVVFQGWEGWFAALLPHRDLVADRLSSILSTRVRAMLAEGSAPTIAVHVRRGDKKTLPFRAPFTGESWQTLHDQWFINALASVRRAMGEQAPATVFSDGSPEQLAQILAVPGVTLSPRAPSIVDILRMARAKVLITSAGSSFSGWGSFLGRMPTVYYPGSKLDLLPDRPRLAVETDLDGALPESVGLGG
jgi:hypothetical protein